MSGLSPLPGLPLPSPPPLPRRPPMEVRWVKGGCVSQSAGQVIELNTICFQRPQSPSMLGKRGVGGKSPSNFLLVIKMDAVYFFWHSSYIDVCHQLFVLTWSVLSAAVSPLGLTPLAHKSGRDWLEGDHCRGASQVSSEPLPAALRCSLGGPEVRVGAGGAAVLSPFMLHSPPSSLLFQIAPLLTWTHRPHSSPQHAVYE